MDPYIERYYQGLFIADDHWVRLLQLPASYVFNSDSADGPGEHWICFFTDSDRSVDYMDSYGTAPWEKIYKWPTKNGFGPVRFNQKWLQHPTSSICWAYVIYFLATRSRGLSLVDILRRFQSYDFKLNDNLVISLIWQWAPYTRPHLQSVGFGLWPGAVGINPPPAERSSHASHHWLRIFSIDHHGHSYRYQQPDALPPVLQEHPYECWGVS